MATEYPDLIISSFLRSKWLACLKLKWTFVELCALAAPINSASLLQTFPNGPVQPLLDYSKRLDSPFMPRPLKSVLYILGARKKWYFPLVWRKPLKFLLWYFLSKHVNVSPSWTRMWHLTNASKFFAKTSSTLKTLEHPGLCHTKKFFVPFSFVFSA